MMSRSRNPSGQAVHRNRTISLAAGQMSKIELLHAPSAFDIFVARKEQTGQNIMSFSVENCRDLPVLVIEDQPMIAWDVSDMLRGMGFEKIVVACTAPAAVLASESQTPKLIISDLHLGDPRATAISALKRIDSQGEIPKVLVTGCDLDEEVETLTRAPNCAFVRKPFRHDDLRDAIAEVLVPNQAGAWAKPKPVKNATM